MLVFSKLVIVRSTPLIYKRLSPTSAQDLGSLAGVRPANMYVARVNTCRNSYYLSVAHVFECTLWFVAFLFMMLELIWLLFSACLALALAHQECPVNSDDTNIEEYMSSTTEGFKGLCSLYLAPSSIPDAGYGIFTIRPLKKQEEIFVGQSPSVIVLDRELHTNATWPLLDYFWTTYGAGTYESPLAETWEPTPFGTLANYHPYLTKQQHLLWQLSNYSNVAPPPADPTMDN